jgi:DMSO/TMAO reductase YedYZ molybdopterin-dependent catalytic subunit
MIRLSNKLSITICLFVQLLIVIFLCACSPDPTAEFPDFITKNEDYFTTRIRDVPVINGETYRLSVSGLIEHPRMFTIDELAGLDLVELTLTTECIGNPVNGGLVGTVVWKGFRLYDLLQSLGLDDHATGVKYLAADGYYASHTLEQIKNSQVIGALFMNGELLPPEQGFPLRILIPGYYGAKQPAWVTELQVIDTPLEDYWQDRGWDLTPPMDVDSIIFFPLYGTEVTVGHIVEIGGAAFGGTRIAKVEVSSDSGLTWRPARIVQSMNADNVWVFWSATADFMFPGTYTIYSRATDINGIVQPEADDDYRDGTNARPAVTVNVTGP